MMMLLLCSCLAESLGKSQVCLYPEGKEFQASDLAKWMFESEYLIVENTLCYLEYTWGWISHGLEDGPWLNYQAHDLWNKSF